MKEIIAVIRRDKLPATKDALEAIGFPSMSIHSVDGRGKQRGDIQGACDPDGYCEFESSVKMKPTPSSYALEHTLPKVALYVPKRMLTIIVPDDMVQPVVKAIIGANKTGQHGDGRVFVAPIEEARMIRTGAVGTKAVV